MFEHTALGVHGRFPELLVGHLTETFVALGFDEFLVTAAVLHDEVVTLLVVPAVLAVVALGALVQRRHGDVEVACINDSFHVAEEEGDDQRGDVCTIDVGIGHDDHFVVTNAAQVQRFGVFGSTDGHAQGGEDVANLLALEHFVFHSFLDVEDLTAEGQDSLVNAVASGLGGTACGVTLDEEEFALGRIFALAIGEFARQATAAEGRFALHVQTSVAGSDTGLSGQDDFLHDLAGIVRMLLEVVGQRLTHGLVDHTHNFRVTEFGLGLALELRLSHLDRDNGREALAKVVGVDGRFALLVTQLGFLQQFALLGVLVHDAGQGSAETGHVGTTFDGVDIVHVGVYVLVEIGVVDHRHLHGRAVFVGVQVDYLGDKRGAGLVDVTNELGKTFLGVVDLALVGAFGFDLLAVLVEGGYGSLALVGKGDAYAGIEEREFAHTVGEAVPLVDGLGEDGVIGPELHAGTGTFLGLDILTGDAYGEERFALGVLLLIDVAVATNGHFQVVGERVHAADAHTMKTTGHFVTVFVELTAGVEHGHYDLECGTMLFRVLVHWNTTTVVFDGDAVVFVDCYLDVAAEACEGLVNRVVHNLINQVMQTLHGDVTDVHCRAFAHCFQAFEHLDTLGTVVFLNFCHYVSSFFFFNFASAKLLFFSDMCNRGLQVFLR